MTSKLKKLLLVFDKIKIVQPQLLKLLLFYFLGLLVHHSVGEIIYKIYWFKIEVMVVVSRAIRHVFIIIC